MTEPLAVLTAFVALNAFTMLAFWWDKTAATIGGRRTLESTLLLLATLGGSVGAIAGQQIFRHKTRKEPFRSRLRTIAGSQPALGLIALGYFLTMVLFQFFT